MGKRGGNNVKRALIFKRVISVIMVIIMVGAVPVSAAEQPEEVTLYEVDDYIAEPDVQQETYAEAASLSSTSSAATSGVCGDNLTWVFDEATGTLTISGTGEMWNYGSDSRVPWYQIRGEIAKVVVGNGVTTVGDYAFSGCNGVTEICLPDGIKSLGYKACYECGITSIDFPNSITSFGDSVFARCSRLTNVKIPNGITCITNNMFSNCINLTSIEIPDSVTSFEKGAFTRCIRLTNIDIPSGVTKIGESAFVNCRGLINIELPDNVVSIGSRAFVDCTELTNINIPSGISTIESETFNGCTKLADIKLPLGITSIGESAFKGCSSLTNIVIPKGVTKIGDYAFSNCTKIVNIEIPSGVTNIANGLFSGCSGLKSVELPNRITSIGNSAFSNCSRLSAITIPNRVTYIGSNAFHLCVDLTNIEIPDSVSSIGANAFSNCTGLTNVIIPNNVTNIPSGLFIYCRNLINVVIPGETTNIGKKAFYNCKALENIYFLGTYEQWNDISIEDTSKYFSEANIICVGTESGISSVKVPWGQYLIHVVGSNGKALFGAEVVYDSKTQYTDVNGDARFNSFTISTPTITVSLVGYKTWTNANSNWEKSESRYETIVLYSEDEGAYKLSEALYSSSEDMSHPYNLLVNTKTVSKLNTGNLVGDFGMGSFFISCRATDISNVSAYQLWQGEKKVAESVNGFFELHVDNFEKGGDCFVRVVANDGTSVDTSINLQIDTNEVNEDNSVKISEGKVTIKVGDDVPFIGGQNVEVKLPDELPIDFEFTDTKVHIGFNIKRFDSDNNKEDKWQNMKETLESLSNLGKLDLDKTTEKELDELIKENKSMQLPGTGSVKVYLLGYAEADWGSSVAQGSLYLVVKASTKTIDFNTVVVSVPVTVQIKVTAEMKSGGDVSYNWSENTFNTGIVLDLTVGLNAFGGVGVGKLVGVGAYGDAKLLIESELKGTDPGLKKIDLTGELGLKAYVAWFTYERAFAHRTWHIYTANNTRAGISLLNASNSFSAGNYNVEALDYLANESAWVGYPISTFAIGASTAFKTLLAGTYRNSQPIMVSNGDMLYAAFLRADSSTNKVYVVLSYYNGAGWSEPKRVDGNAILDDAPQLLSDSAGNLWMTYASTTSAADTNSIASYATNQNIVVGSIDANAEFIELNRYTPSSDTYAHMQTLAIVNGAPTLFWVESVIKDDDDIFSSNTNTVKYAVYSGGTWGSAQTLTTIAHPIRQLTAGGNGVACNIDIDNDLNTTDDLQLTAYSMSGTSSVIASGITGNMTYGTLPGASTANFIWNGDGVLYCGDAIITMPGITNEYAVVGDSVYYSSAEDGGSALTLMKYDGSSWSEPIRLISSSVESRYFENLSAAELNGKDYVFGLNTAVDISEDRVTPDKNLVWASVDPVSDLRIDSVDYDATAAIPGEQIPVVITVMNGGDHAASDLCVTIDGVEQTIGSINLAPGKSTEIPISITCPNTEKTFNICVAARNEPFADDFNPDDNSYELTLGLANVVTYLSYEQIGTSRTLVASVTNEGISSASGTVVFYDAEGTSYGKTDFKELESGDVVVVRLPLPDSFAGKYEGGNVCVEARCDQNELFEFDNRATAYLYESTGISIDTVESTSAGIEAQITYYGQPNGANVFCAFYDSHGRMISSQLQMLNVGTQSVIFGDVKNAAEAKVFVLSTENCPLCKSKGIVL